MTILDSTTMPAPGTGYGEREGSWWRDPLSDLLEGATGRLEEALDLDTPDYVPQPPLEPARAEIVPAGLGGPLLFAGALALGWALLRPR